MLHKVISSQPTIINVQIWQVPTGGGFETKKVILFTFLYLLRRHAFMNQMDNYEYLFGNFY